MHANAHLGALFSRYDTRLDAGAGATLHSLLIEAADKLGALGEEPLCVLECPRRMNKGVGNSRAARVASQSKCSWAENYGSVHQSAPASPELEAANIVLQGLIDRGWRRLFFKSFDFHPSLAGGTALALLVDEGNVFLAAMLEFASEGPFYKLDPVFHFELVGVCERLAELDGIRPIEWLPAAEWAERRSRLG